MGEISKIELPAPDCFLPNPSFQRWLDRQRLSHIQV